MQDAIADRRLRALVAVCLLFAGCSASQPQTQSYYKSVQTELIVHSTPNVCSVYVDNRYAGITPLDFPLKYEQEVQENTEKVTYWHSNPGLATVLTLASLGLYLPFSFIPVEDETTTLPLDNYRANRFEVTVNSAGYQPWKQEVRVNGQRYFVVEPQLTKQAQN
jgi:hypothetical protein